MIGTRIVVSIRHLTHNQVVAGSSPSKSGLMTDNQHGKIYSSSPVGPGAVPVIGVAWTAGWEIGRCITQNAWYQETVHGKRNPSKSLF